MTLLEILPIVLLGVICGLDVVSFPQAMISRPIVAATAAGALGGHPGDGLLIGAVLELIALETLPFGASRYPEWGTASVIGGALFVDQAPLPGALPLCVFAALCAAMVSGSSMVAIRRLNGRWAGQLHDEVERGSRRAVMRLQLGGLTADVLRAALVTFVLIIVLRPIVVAAGSVWAAPATLSTALVVGIATAVAGGIIWNALPAGSHRVRAGLIAIGVVAAVVVGR
ncbi:MAG TPA: PTS sugar transporter subunit IIC [Gemmatimonadaceae bacterium]|nr:PTS sugar transporter subunit IIC [Gemmatimonadaceae bacterium]